MNKIYTKNIELRTSDFDYREQIKASAILDIFQEIAGAHATELKVGFSDLLEKKLLWVLVKVKFEIVRNPKMHEGVVAKTWPLAPGRVTLQREYLIEDKEGNTLVKGTSEWVTMHLETRRLVQSSDIYPLDEFCQEKTFEERTKKVSDFEANEIKMSVTPGFCDIDENRHVNNTRYADYVINAYCPDEDEKIAVFQLDFHREIIMGSTFNLYQSKQDNILLSKGVSMEGEKMFSCSVEFKK